MNNEGNSENGQDDQNEMLRIESIKEIKIESNKNTGQSTGDKFASRIKYTVNNLDLLITALCLAELSSEIPANQWKIEENNQNKTNTTSQENTTTSTTNLLGRLERFGEAINTLGKTFCSDASVYIYLSILLSFP